jgi:TolA-binding protein/DNA-binding MarR family transcriptional regulator
MTIQIPTYNPRLLPHKVLESMLVGRKDIIEDIFSDLERQVRSESRQHWLIRGPRGIGKTHLAGVLYHRIKSDSQLAKHYFPVWLNETAAYEVYSAGTLLRTIAKQLLEELIVTGDPAADDFEKSIDSIDIEGDDPLLFEEFCELLNKEADRRQKILLILMENLDAILHSFAKHRKVVEVTRVRALLAQEKVLLLVSTTPTSYLADLSDPKQPLYGHLKERRLQPLTEEETRQLIENLGALTGRLMKDTNTGSDGERRLRNLVLHRLTGGSPRGVVMAFSIMTGTSGLQAVVDDFRTVLDAYTPYFETRLSHLATRERVIVTAMALAPTNLTMKEIAQGTGLSQRSLSTLIDRIRLEGLVTLSQGEGGKGAVYELSDGFLRLWYQYRRGRTILPDLVRFLALWHSEEELGHALKALKSAEHDTLLPLDRERLETTAFQVEEALRYARSEAGMIEREKLWSECERDLIVETKDRLPKNIEKIVLQAVQEMKPEPLQKALSELSELLLEQPQDNLALKINAAKALINVGVCLRNIDRHDKAESAFRKIIQHFGKADDPKIQAERAKAMLNLGVTLGQLDRSDEEMKVYRDMIERFADSDHSELQVPAARAMLNLGVTLGQLDRSDEEMKVYRDMIERFADSDHSELQEQAARAMLNLGVTLGQLDRSDEEMKVYRDMIERFADSDHSELQVPAARAMLNLGVTLGQLDRSDEEMKVYRDMIERFADSDHSELQEQAARAMLNLGVTLGQLDRSDEAEVVYRDMIERFADSDHSELQETFLSAIVNQVTVLMKQRRLKEAEKVLYRVLDLQMDFRNRGIRELFDPLLRLILIAFPPQIVRDYFDELKLLSGKDLHEKLGFFGLILDVLEAQEPALKKKSRKGPAARRREVLARVPPELRPTIEEAVSQITELKRQLRGNVKVESGKRSKRKKQRGQVYA